MNPASSPAAATGRHADWGVRAYAELHAIQAALVVTRAEGRTSNLLLTGEHLPVVTLGRKTPDGFPDTVGGTPVVVVERGGEATWHGPGQLVAYPLVHLTEARRDLHRFQRDLEEVGIRTCAHFGLEATRVEGKTGVWVGGRKVMSLGIAVRRWVTWHGLALNVENDLSPFHAFSPCGLPGAVMTSLSEALGRHVPLAEVRPVLVHHAGNLLPGGPFTPTPWDLVEALARG